MARGYAPGASAIPKVSRLEIADLQAAFGAGLSDLRAAPGYAFWLSLPWVLGGWLMVWLVAISGEIWWMIPAALGFPLLGPVVAVAFYEISRRLERGEPLQAGAILGLFWRDRDRQLPSLAAVILVFFLFWNFLSHVIFALFLGLQVMTNLSASFEVLFTGPGLAMIVCGTVAGAVFSGLLFSLIVAGLPLVLDREVDFITAMLTSLDVVKANPLVMLIWGCFIAVMVFVAMLPGFLGLFLVLPVFGHASWHLYRRALP